LEEDIEAQSTVPSTSSQKFTSLISKYSYTATNLSVEEQNTTPITPPKTPKSKPKKRVLSRSLSESRNPGYAPPSAYAHLPTPDLDRLAENLVLCFIGLNPGRH
jgi:hypothetical protein